jgi:YidC/Oxa1 family membrane protein insertase
MLNIFFTIIIYPIIQILEFSFTLSEKLFKESGFSIIFISMVITILCLPLYSFAEKWQRREREIQANLKPKISKIREVFAGDEQYMILSTFYRQNHYHPVYTLRSSFGLLIQIPFFIAAYSFLYQLEVIRDIPFLFVHSLSKPDSLLTVNGISINVLPILMTLINCLSSTVYTRGLAIKDKIQLYGIALLFLLLLYRSPSALVIYWTMNNIFSLIRNVFYRLPLKHKNFLLMLVFSVLLTALGLFSIFKFNYNTKAQKLSQISIFMALVPWVFYFLKKHFGTRLIIKTDPRKSLAVFMLSLFLIWALFGLFIPSQLVAASPQEFSFLGKYGNPLHFVFNTSFQVFGFFVFWPICLYFLFPANTKKAFSIFFTAASFLFLVNTFIFPGEYGIISVNLVYENNPGHNGREILFNLGILLITGIFSVFLNIIKNKKIIVASLFILFFSLSCASFINIHKINRRFGELKTYYSETDKKVDDVAPLFKLSKNGVNVVIIMLDRAFGGFIPHIFNESPELTEIFSGFVFYPNTVSFNGFTRIGAPPVFGGYEYTPLETNKRDTIPLVEKHNQALLMLPGIFSENGFSVFVTDPPFANYKQKSDLSIYNDYKNTIAYITDAGYTDTWLSEHELKLPETETIIERNLFWYSLLKGLPFIFRQPLYMDGTWCAPFSNNKLRLTLNAYSVLDYLPQLTEITDDDANALLLMVNNITHENSFLQAPLYKPVIAVSNYGSTQFAKEPAYHVNAASIRCLADWFSWLKDEKVYDNTRIILVSDHGPVPNFITKTDLPFNIDQFNPLLMVKDFDKSGPLKTDMTFMANADVPFLAVDGIIENPVNPFTQNLITNNSKNEPLYIAISGSIHLTDINDTRFVLNKNFDYYVHENIFNPGNWVKAGKK